MKRLLILGGTSEASALARAMTGRPEIETIMSFAGRTENPAEPPVPYRIGGFGGVDGLTSYLMREAIGAVVDATHPFAARISAHAAAAVERAGLPLAMFSRAAWEARSGDDWRRVPDLESAALAIGPRSRRVFLTSGRLGLSVFRQAAHHAYLLRTIDPPALADCPPRCEIILARPPFDAAAEEELMRHHRIEILVTKNSGGLAGEAKLAAARALRLPVIMVERPAVAWRGACFTDLGEVLGWIRHHVGSPSDGAPPGAAP